MKSKTKSKKSMKAPKGQKVTGTPMKTPKKLPAPPMNTGKHLLKKGEGSRRGRRGG